MKSIETPLLSNADLQPAPSETQPRYGDNVTSARYVSASNDRAYYMHQHIDELASCSSSEFFEHQGYRKPNSKTPKPSTTNATTDKTPKAPTQTTIRPKATAHMLRNDTRMQPQLARPQKQTAHTPSTTLNIPERTFMNGLIKHTVIALAIIIPLAAFSAYAETPENYIGMQAGFEPVSTHDNAATQAVRPTDIIYNNSNTPTAVDSVDLHQYAGTWHEIARLPMYFQRNCARDVTATYTLNDDDTVGVLNKCVGDNGETISADGIAHTVDDSGSKLKVTFLPSWLRWLPVGRANYWVLARDAGYNTALVGTPDKKYLWLLARTPDISENTYAKYRQIATDQGYDLNEFTLTTQSGQTVDLSK